MTSSQKLMTQLLLLGEQTRWMTLWVSCTVYMSVEGFCGNRLVLFRTLFALYDYIIENQCMIDLHHV